MSSPRSANVTYIQRRLIVPFFELKLHDYLVHDVPGSFSSLLIRFNYVVSNVSFRLALW